MLMKRFLIWVAALLPGIACACYNDRDTLGYELKNKPDLQRALTGRFDRYPALYYSMRVDRLRAKPRLTPAEYDDLAVALDRQGKSDEALAAIARKLKLSGLSHDDRYRFYANRGTIRAHRWLRLAGKGGDPAELAGAADDIAKALKLNPKAHFGREGTQLEVIRWIIDIKKHPKDAESLGMWLSEKAAADVDVPKGLAGLIMLGAAWESPDAAFAIAELEATSERDTGTSELAMARYDELVAAGKPRFVPDVNDAAYLGFRDMLGKRAPKGEPPVKARFVELRKEAEAWHQAKTAYMLTRLEAGKHPDTDPSFWSDWKETPMPKLPVKLPQPPPPQFLLAIGGGVLLLVALVLVLFRGRKSRLGTGE